MACNRLGGAPVAAPAAVPGLMTTREIAIGLLWHSDRSGNLGVGALTVGNIAIARAVAAELGLTPRFTILGFGDAGTPYIADDDVTFAPLGARTIAAFVARLGRLDCVLDIGAGDSFTDIYPLKRFAWIVLSKVATIARGVPLVFSPQTIGPFGGPRTKNSAATRWLGRVAAWTVRRACAVVVRDDKSLDAVRALAPGVVPVFAVDVAFALPWTPAPTVAGRLRIGLNVSGLLWRGGYTGRGEFNLGYDYKELMTRLIEALLAADDCTVELITHVNGYATSPDNDGAVADELAARFPALVRVADFASPSAAKSHISGLDALIAARMHASIAAFSSGVPVIPVSYSRKFEGLFGSLGYARVVPHTGMDTATALAFVLAALGDRTMLKDEVADGLTRVAARLDAYRGVLRTLFVEIRDR